MKTSPEELVIYIGPPALAAAVISGLGSSNFFMGFILGTIILTGMRAFMSGDVSSIREFFSRKDDDHEE